jgi:hypothetical protein
VAIQFLQQGDNATTFPAHTRNPELTQINLLLEHSKVSDQIFEFSTCVYNLLLSLSKGRKSGWFER